MTEVYTIASKVDKDLIIAGITVHGNTRVPPGESRKQQFLGPYVLTPDFPKDAWDKWAADNAKSHMVVNEMIFAGPDENIRARLLPRTIPRQFGEVPYVSPNS